MNFDLTEEQRMIKETARDFALREVEPKAKDLDKTGRWPSEIVERMAELGFLGMMVPMLNGMTMPSPSPGQRRARLRGLSSI